MIKFFLLFQILLIPSIITSAEKPLAVNDKAPPVNLRGMDKKIVFIDEILEDKPVIISFFFVNCPSCKKEISDLHSLQKKYNSDVAFFLISTDAAGADVVSPFVTQNSITIQVLLDRYRNTASLWGVEKYPALFVIGRDKKIHYISTGYHEDTIHDIEVILDKIRLISE